MTSIWITGLLLILLKNLAVNDIKAGFLLSMQSYKLKKILNFLFAVLMFLLLKHYLTSKIYY